MKIHYLSLFIFFNNGYNYNNDPVIFCFDWEDPAAGEITCCAFWMKLYLLWLVFPLFLSRVLTYICCTVSAVCASGISPVQYVEETRAHDISISNKKLSNTASPLFLKWILLSAIAVCRGAADKQLVHKGQTITETAAALQRDQGTNP